MTDAEEETGAVCCVKSWKYRAYLLLAAAGCVLFYLWLGSALPGFMQRRERVAELKPLLTGAEALALTYEKVLENPSAAIGKPVIWCIQNKGEYEVTVGGEEGKRLKILNYPAMPRFSGSKHSACAEMLIVVTEVPAQELQARITARFVESMNSPL